MPLNRRFVHGVIVALATTIGAFALVSPALGYKAEDPRDQLRDPAHQGEQLRLRPDTASGYAFAKQNICTFANNNVTT